MSSLAKEVRKFIIIPALNQTSLWSESAEILVYGTGWIETGYDHIMQIGTPKNGGVGPFQCQPSDYLDTRIWLQNGFTKGMMQRILFACSYSSLSTDADILASNWKLAALMCRVHYYRIKEPLPQKDDAEGMAHYHFKYYNGNGEGKTNVERNTDTFRRIINGEL